MNSQILQAAIDGLSANIAVVSQDGTIIAVNRAWCRFAETNGLALSDHAMGANYLKVCDAAAAVEAAQAAGNAIRRVLGGDWERFELRFLSRDVDADRWSRIAVTPADLPPERLAVISHEIIDEVIGSRAMLDFEDLVAELSAAFVRTPADEVDNQINRWLEQIARALELDRASIAEFDDDRQLHTTHQWTRPGLVEVPIGMNASRTLPWLAQRLLAGELTVLSSDEDVPSEAGLDLVTARNLNFKSNVTIPLRAGETIVGGFACGTVVQRRSWSPRLVRRLQTVAQIFSNALDRKRSQQGMRKLRREVAELSRVTLMGELTASLAHELNQPLGAILNNAQAARRLLKSRKIDLKELRGAVNGIIRDDARASETIRTIRELFKPAAERMTPVDARRLIGDAERIMREDARIKRIALRTQTTSALPKVRCDRTQIVQVIMNLLMNAFDAISADGDGPREVVVAADQQGSDLVALRVVDSGPGIAPHVMPKIFDAFFTTRHGGMGMGLAIAKSIVNNHGGEIRVFRNPVRGATLEFTLPTSR